MLGHPGGEQHSRYLIELAFLPKGTKWLDMGAGDGSTVRLLRSIGYCAEGIDLEPRGKDVTREIIWMLPGRMAFLTALSVSAASMLAPMFPAH